MIGRINRLFSNTSSDSKASAMLYSIVETTRANGLTPFDYIAHCLEQLRSKDIDVEKLLP